MRIGIFTNAYHPLVSGVVNAIDCIDQGLTQLGHQVVIVAPRYNDIPGSDDRIVQFPSISLTSKANFPLPFPYVPHLARKIESLKLDIIHVQHPFLLGALGQRIANRKKNPLVFTFHTLYEQYVHYAPPVLPQSFLQFAVRKMVSSFVRKSNAIVVPSPSILKLVESYGGKGRTHLIPNGINLQPFQNATGRRVREIYKLANKRVLIFVGRLAEEKNLSFLIRSFAKVRERIPNAVLMLVGDGPYRKALEAETARLGISNEILFTGMVPYPEIPDFMASADLFVTCSTTEVKPLSILEAMATGLAVLSVKASGAVDTITDEVDGYLVHENEGEFAAAAIALLDDDKKLNELSRHAKKTAEGFGILEMARKLEQLYLSLRSEI